MSFDDVLHQFLHNPVASEFTVVRDDELDDSQREYIAHLRQIWRPIPPARISIPHTWIEKDIDFKADAFGLGIRAISSMTFDVLKDVISPLSQDDLDEVSFSNDPLQTRADYTLARERKLHDWYYRESAPLQADPVSRTSYAQTRVIELMRCEGDRELEAQVLISSCLQRIPGAFVRTEPRTLFPPSALSGIVSETTRLPTLPPVDISAVADNEAWQISPDELTDTDLGIPGVVFASIYQPFPSVDVKKDQRLPICFLHPALVIGTKGPVHWTHRYGNDLRPGTMSKCMAQSFHFAKPNLDVLLLAWHLKHQEVSENPVTHNPQDPGAPAPHANPSQSSDGAASVSPLLPPWMMIIGIIYDAECVQLIAHFARHSSASVTSSKTLHPLYEYRSCIIDTLPMKQEADTDLKTYLVDRLRVAVALIALQRHVLRALSILDGVIWPIDVIAEETDRLAKALGEDISTELPPRTPSPSVHSVHSDDFQWYTFESDGGESGIVGYDFANPGAHAADDPEDAGDGPGDHAEMVKAEVHEWLAACK